MKVVNMCSFPLHSVYETTQSKCYLNVGSFSQCTLYLNKSRLRYQPLSLMMIQFKAVICCGVERKVQGEIIRACRLRQQGMPGMSVSYRVRRFRQSFGEPVTCQLFLAFCYQVEDWCSNESYLSFGTCLSNERLQVHSRH